MSSRIKDLESKSIYIIREAKFKFKNLAILWSGGKDSTILIDLARKAFTEEEFDDITIITLDTNHLFPETYDYINKIIDLWNINNFVITKSFNTQVFDPRLDIFKCCNKNKTENLRSVIQELSLDAIIVGIRRDEQEIRNKERFFSPRDTDGRWDIWAQPCELQGWDIYCEEAEEGEHIRVHPILEWSEVEVWEYIKENNIPVHPLYFSKNGKRLRSIGCKPPCTDFIESEADTIDKIIKEISDRGGTEREGRHTEKETLLMQRLRSLGYF